LFVLPSCFVIWSFSEVTRAHGFGQRYDLPVPLIIWVLGAGATIILSFVLTAAFARGRDASISYSRVNLLQWRVFRFVSHASILFLIRTVGVMTLIMSIVAGFWGDPDPYQNLTPVLVWVIWWVGIAYGCVLVGDLWSLINPFRTLYIFFEYLIKKWLRVKYLSCKYPYPEALKMWPAVVGLVGFFWSELLWSEGSRPFNLAIVITLYSCVTWIGMFVYGRETWLQNADPFSVVFGIFSRFAPLEIRVRTNDLERHCAVHNCRYKSGDCINGYGCLISGDSYQLEWNLRPPAVGLLQEIRVPVSMMVFVLILLASVTFDGFLDTSLWIKILDRTMGQEIFLVANLALLLFPMFFCVIYLLFCRLVLFGAGLASQDMSKWRAKNSLEVACAFILTLVPIVIAYHLAHYLSFLLITGQYLVSLASDPLGLGWNIFGTAGYQPNISVLSARTNWYVATISVICGHAFSVYIAHRTAIRVFHDVQAALYSQIPMIVLMALYTMLSLWILAQPMVV